LSISNFTGVNSFLISGGVCLSGDMTTYDENENTCESFTLWTTGFVSFGVIEYVSSFFSDTTLVVFGLEVSVSLFGILCANILLINRYNLVRPW
jgi:hypothetical protein